MKAEPRTGFNFDLGSTVPRLSIGAALTLTWRTTKEQQKNGQLRKQPRHHIGKREDPGEEVGCASYNTNRPRCNWQGIGQAIKRNANAMRTLCERRNAGRFTRWRNIRPSPLTASS